MRNENEQTPQSVIKGPFIKSYTPFKGWVFTHFPGKICSAHVFFSLRKKPVLSQFTLIPLPAPC